MVAQIALGENEGRVSNITSADGSVILINPQGEIVDLSATPDTIGGVAKGVQILWLEDQPGVAIDGITECGAAIQAAISAAESFNVALQSKPGRVYITASTLTVTKSCDLWGSTIGYSGNGNAIVIGDPVNGVTRQHFRIGRVVSTAFSIGWATAGTIGVQIVDCNKSRIDIKSVVQFFEGVQMLGHARGCAYNEVHISELATNKVNLHQTSDTAVGYCNQNQIYGGSWNHDQALAGGTLVAGTKHVWQNASGGGSVPNTNLFYGCAFEGNVVEYMVDSTGLMNTFRDCRWEATAPAVRWGVGTYGNVIRDGLRPNLITITNSGDTTNAATWSASGDIYEIIIQPQNIYVAAGTAVLAAVLRNPVMNVTVASTDVLAFNALLPPNWHTYDVEVHMLHDSATAGTVAWTWRPLFLGAGDTVIQPTGTNSGTIIAAAQKVMNVQTIVTAQVAVPGKRLVANIFPGGGSFVGVVSVAAIVLRRRS